MDDRPLVITGNEEMLDELLRVAAAAGIEVAHTDDAGARSGWRSASLVLIDTASVAEALAAQLPRRSGVVAVDFTELTGESWSGCVQLGVDRAVVLGNEDDVLIDLLAGTASAGPGGGATVAVISACGGAGASVLCGALATVAERSGRGVLLADCDPWAPGLDVLLGIEDGGGVHWNDLAAPSGRLPADALHRALPTAPVGRGRIAVLCHSRSGGREISPDVVDVVIESGRRAGDLTVVDLPRHPTAAGDAVLEKADLVVLVTTSDVRGCFGAVRIANRLTAAGVMLELVIRGPSPGGIGADDVAGVLGLPILARMRPQPHLARDLENGRAPGSDVRGPLARAAATVLHRVESVGR